MTRYGTKTLCDGCGFAIQLGETISYSGIYGAKNVELCPYCQKREEDAMEKAGTNDIQELRDLYTHFQTDNKR